MWNELARPKYFILFLWRFGEPGKNLETQDWFYWKYIAIVYYNIFNLSQ